MISVLSMFIVTFFCMYLIRNTAGITGRVVNRIHGYYVAKAGLVHALEVLRKGGDPETVTASWDLRGPGVNPCGVYRYDEKWIEAIIETNKVDITDSAGVSYEYKLINSAVNYK